jgi:hypothetical protein
MSIKDNLEKARKAIANDIAKGDKALGLAKDVGEAAIEAVTYGLVSDQGKKYMALFCDTPNELLQLTAVRETDEDYMPQMRAYIPADGVCQPSTNSQFATRVDENIEPPPGSDALAGATEPSAIRDNALAERLRQG